MPRKPKLSNEEIELFEKLGFSGELPDRTPEILEGAIEVYLAKFRMKNRLAPASTISQEQARRFALEFCLELDSRGERFWPDKFHEYIEDGKPSWTSDKHFIKSSLARIVQLRGNSRQNRSDKPPVEVMASSPAHERQWSFDVDIPDEQTSIDDVQGHSGFDTAPDTADSGGFNDDDDEQLCRDEIMRVNSKHFPTVFQEFTATWLSNPESRWSEAADNCIKLFMFNNNIYSSNIPPRKLRVLEERLKQNTKLESEVYEPGEWATFAKRLEGRIQLLAESLHNRGLIAWNEETCQYEKSTQLTSLWNCRSTIWRQDTSPSKLSSIGLVPTLDQPDNSNNGESEVKHSARPYAPPRKRKIVRSIELPDGKMIPKDETTPSKKRQKSNRDSQRREVPNSSSPSPIESFSHWDLDATISIPELTAGDSNGLDSSTRAQRNTSAIICPEPSAWIPRTPIAPKTTIAPQTTKRNASRTLDLATPPPSALLTPISTTNVRTTSILTPTLKSRLQADRPSISPKSKPASMAEAMTAPSTPSIVSANLNLSTKDDKAPPRELEFIFQKKSSATNLDWNSKMPLNQDTSLGVKAFFETCSNRWRLPPEYLTCLVLSLNFDPLFEPETINRGDEQAWQRFKEETERKFRNSVRQQPEKLEFLIRVEMELSQIKECARS